MSEEKEEIKLTGKQKVFADYYIGEANLNGFRAAKLARYKGSDATLRSIASENLTKPNILAYIEKRLDELTLTSKETFIVLTNHAKGSIADILEPDGQFDYAAMCERGADKLLKKLKIKKTIRREKDSADEIEEITHEFEMYDAQSAAVHIGKAHGLFVEKHEHTGKNGEPIQTVELSLSEWRKQAAERRAQAARTQELFNDENS